MSYEKQRADILHRVDTGEVENFAALALAVFRFQATFNPVYARYLSLLKIDIQTVEDVSSIPFLPIQFFKNYSIKTGEWEVERVFSSSGTTGLSTSQHFVHDLAFYQRNTVRGFEKYYGHPRHFCTLALLPSYLERSGSSLIDMAAHFIRLSSHPASGFFLNNTDELRSVLQKLMKNNIPTLLLGVSFALLDLAEENEIDLRKVIIMETGGMKGRRKEMTRQELHGILGERFNTESIHSEYGMTELFSQAYSRGKGVFAPSPTMMVLSWEITDPLTLQRPGKTGVLNIIDLANFDTCSFIATEDLGKVSTDGTFEVLGRLDHSDIRGCNLLLDQD